MTDPTLGSAREEAERLVVAALAAAQVATRRLSDASNLAATGNTLRGLLSSLARSAAPDPADPASPFAPGHTPTPAAEQTPPPAGDPADPTARFAPGHTPTPAAEQTSPPAGDPAAGFATGEPQCCVCPICRVIAALRDPSPEVAERLATGAGDFAAGLASLLRALGEAAGRSAGEPRSADGEDDLGDDLGGYPEDAPGHGGDPFESSDAAVIWAAATHAAAGARTAEPDRPRPAAATGEAPATATPRKPMAKKAVKQPAPATPSSASLSESPSGSAAPPSSEPPSGSAAPPSKPRSEPSPAMKTRPGTAADGVSGVAGVAAGSDPVTAADDDDHAAGGAAGG